MKSTLITLMMATLIGQYLVAQVTIKGTYEDWCTVESIPFDDPQCWETTNPLCVARSYPENINLTEDANTGTYAMVLETGMDSMGMPFPAVASFKNKITNRPEKITGYYKADLKEDDYSSIRISLITDRGMIGWGVLDITKSTNVYTHFELPIHYISATAQPDSFTLFIYSSYAQAATGTTLVLDDLALESLTDVAIPLTERFTTRVTPNPATDEILVAVPEGLDLVTIRIFDSNGQIVENEDFENQIKIDVSAWTAGLYFFEVRLKNHEIYDKGRIRVAEHRL